MSNNRRPHRDLTALGATAWDLLTRPSRHVSGTVRVTRARALAGILVVLLPALLLKTALLLGSPPLPKSALEVGLSAGPLLATLAAYVVSRTRWHELSAALLVVTGVLAPSVAGYLETTPVAIGVALSLVSIGIAFACLFFSLRVAVTVATGAFLWTCLVSSYHPLLTGSTRLLPPTAVFVLGVLLLAANAVSLRVANAIVTQGRQVRDLVERAPFGVAALHGDRIAYANATLLAILGIAEPAHLLRTHFLDRVHPEDRAVFLAGSTGVVNVRVLTESGTPRLLELSRLREFSFDDQPADLLVARDVTAERDLNQQVLLMERLASLGAVAASVGHEINNPLTFVLFNLDFLREELRELLTGTEAPDRAREALAVLADTRDGAKRASEIVTELKAFGGVADETTEIDVHSVLRSALRIAGTELRHRARVLERLEPVPPVRGSPARLGQILLNLLVNAAQAIPPGAADKNQVTLTTRVDAGGMVVITISDTGMGVPEELRHRIFEPFFTTKPSGQGTGLGLSICVKLIRELGGELELDSAVGAGSSFRVRLPSATRGSDTAPNTAPPPSRGAGRGRVLVVDDERPAAEAIGRLLRDHAVTVALNGEEALEFCRRQRFDVIVCDLVMPRRSGWELYAALAAERPGQEQRMVFVTAGASIPAARSFLDGVANPVLEKPFAAEALQALVRDYCRRPTESVPPSGGRASPASESTAPDPTRRPLAAVDSACSSLASARGAPDPRDR